MGGWGRRTRILLAVGVVVGVVGWLVTGWLLVLPLGPVVVAGLPVLLLSAPVGVARIEVLQGVEEWTRALSGVLRVGVGLEEALIASARSAPAPIAGEVSRLVARLQARWPTDAALRGFADELGDATADLAAAYLILGARRRGAGLAAVLEALAESVAAEVRARRQVEADRAKPRTTARWVTADHRRRPGRAGVHRGLHRPLRHPGRAADRRPAARRVRRDAAVDAADDRHPATTPTPHPPPRPRRSGRAMSTGLQLGVDRRRAGRARPRPVAGAAAARPAGPGRHPGPARPTDHHPTPPLGDGLRR